MRIAEWFAANLASDELVSDSRAIRHYLDKHGRDSTYLTNGAYILRTSCAGGRSIGRDDAGAATTWSPAGSSPRTTST